MKTKTYLNSSGINIVVGMDDEGNDELFLKFAHPRDFWFHVNGMSGSHVILCCSHYAGPIEKTSITEAAAIAAWYSKMRNGTRVSVSYCLTGNVSKPKYSKPGTVVIKNAKRIIVKPGLPDRT
jgi:predicted ribosome quality control (RQC) complex YloA/Tae2 family protein